MTRGRASGAGGCGSGAAAVVLAAGEARRMRGIDKLLLTIDGVPLVRRQIDTLHAAGVERVVVVLGHRPARVEAALVGCELDRVRHAGYALGLQGSVLAGLAALPGQAEPVLVVPGDLPLLEPDDLRALLAAWQARPPGCRALVPWHRGQRGNPVLVDAQAVRAALSGGDSQRGLRGFIDAHPQAVARFDATSDHYTVDLDTPEDIERLERRIGRRVGGWRAAQSAGERTAGPDAPGTRGD